jgi:hypothetical protein
MNSLRLTISLLRIPKLFFSLVFFPLLLSIVFVYFQLILTSATYRIFASDASEVQKNFDHRKDNSFVRNIIFGSGKRLPDAKLCFWQFAKNEHGEEIEIPPNPECSPNRLDVALQIPNINSNVLSEYQRIFNGNVEKIHICKTCTPDIIISQNNKKFSTEIKSIWALMIVGAVKFSSEFQEHYIEAMKSKDDIKAHLGECSLFIGGFDDSIKITGMEADALIVLNFSFLIVVALWLALRAHRKVLDYFSRSGALLPLVAATGKKPFYMSIWLLTVIRVSAFLLAALPLTIISLNEIFDDNETFKVIYNDPVACLLWLIAIIFGLALATLVASLAELKHRHNILSFIYRYIPLLLCGLGAILWGFSLIFEGEPSNLLRNLLTSIPVVGMAPVMIAPLMKPHMLALVIHGALTASLFAILLRYNSRWFAAHLEDL